MGDGAVLRVSRIVPGAQSPDHGANGENHGGARGTPRGESGEWTREAGGVTFRRGERRGVVRRGAGERDGKGRTNRFSVADAAPAERARRRRTLPTQK